jgi:DNA-binding NtrC family response regulator/tetratricopeptide (TPR) repeat protein
MEGKSQGPEELLKPADDLFRAGNFAQALKGYQRIMEGSSLSTATINLLKRKELECLYRLCRYEESLGAIEELRSVYESEGDKKELGWLLSLKAHCLKQLTRLEEGRKTGEEARELLRKTAYNLEYGLALKTLGNIHIGLGDLREAKRLLVNSISAFERVSPFPYREVISSENLLGQVYFMRGELKGGIEHLNEALKLCRGRDKGNKSQEAMILGNLGTVYRRVGDWQKAEKCFNSSLKIKKIIGDILPIARGYISLARLLIVQRNFVEAEKLLDQAENVSQNYPREVAMVHESLGWLEMGLAQREGGSHLKLAEDWLLKALRIGRSIAPDGDIVCEVSEKLGWVYLDSDRLEGALSYAERGLRVARNLGSTYDQALAHRLLGAIYQRRNEKGKATREFAESISLLEEEQALYDLAQSLFYNGRFLIEDSDTLSEGLDKLAQGRKIFQCLRLGYWEGRSLIEEANGWILDGNFDKASRSLIQARDILQRSGEERVLREAIQVRAKLDGVVARFSLGVQEEYTLLEGLNQASSKSLDELLRVVAKRTSAHRALLGFRSNMGLQVGGYLGLEEAEARDLLAKIGSLNGDLLRFRKPLLSSLVSEDERFLPLRGVGIGSLMMVPFGLDDEIDGLLYVDRVSGRSFLQGEANFFTLSANFIALKVTQIRREELEEKVKNLEERLGEGEIITRNKMMLDLLDLIRTNIGPADCDVLIEGESGTGKELVARAIHRWSPRKDKPFVVINCGTIPENLLESELFGHEKGSFTGAYVQRKGKFEVAKGGTIFLDEIGELSPKLQVKLLRVLEERNIERVGGTAPIQLNVRVIAATNRNLQGEMRAHRFRDDLYFRLDHLRVKLRPLRERREDIAPLLQHYLEYYCHEYKREVEGVSPEVLSLLMVYPWPGNIRELMSVVEKGVILARGNLITPDLLPEEIRTQKSRPSERTYSFNLGGPMREILNKVKREVIEDTLKRTGGNKTEAAKLLGITREALSRRLRNYRTEGKM